MADAMETLEPRAWITMIADDRPIGIMICDSAMHKKEQERFDGYHGVKFVRSSVDDLERFKETVDEDTNKRKAAAEKRAARKAQNG